MTWATDPVRRAIWLLREHARMMRDCARDIECEHPGWARDWRDGAKIAEEAALAAEKAHDPRADAPRKT